MERQRLGLRFLEADPGLALREGPGSGEGGGEDGHSQEGAQHGGEEVVDVPEGLEGRKCVRGQKRQDMLAVQCYRNKFEEQISDPQMIFLKWSNRILA